MTRWRRVVVEHTRRRVHIYDDQFRLSITVEITHCQAPRRSCGLKTWARRRADVFKLAGTVLAIQDRVLIIRIPQLLPFYFGINMTVGLYQIRPTVVIDIDKSDPPAK